MKFRWRWILPVLGLLLFLGETWGSIRSNRELRSGYPYRKDFYWGTFRLETDPLNKLPPPHCPVDKPDCAVWSVSTVIIDPGAIFLAFLLSGLPAFFVATRLVYALGHLGVNEIYSFFIAAPPMLFAWYYFLGWLIEKMWNRLRRMKSAAT